MSVKFDLISTGSKGNAIVYEDEVLVDVGVSYKYLVGHLNDVKVLLMTHRHSDHFRIATIKHLLKDNPNVVILCGDWFKPLLEGLEMAHIVYCEHNKWYRVGNIEVSPFLLYHDVDNFGWRIKINGKRIFHATDTVTLDGIYAKGYDLYGIEFHHDELIIEKQIEEKVEAGMFCYEIGARNSHLSFQNAQRWINENKGKDSQVIKLHYSNKYELVNGEFKVLDEYRKDSKIE